MADARQLTFIDFFSGIGGFRRGLELAGMKCVGFCEKDKFAVRSYRAMYDTEGEWYGGDITKLRADDIPQADIWTAGSPCQNLSVAGGRSGLHGDRSGLFFDFIDLLKGKLESIFAELKTVNETLLLESNQSARELIEAQKQLKLLQDELTKLKEQLAMLKAESNQAQSGLEKINSELQLASESYKKSVSEANWKIKSLELQRGILAVVAGFLAVRR